MDFSISLNIISYSDKATCASSNVQLLEAIWDLLVKFASKLIYQKTQFVNGLSLVTISESAQEKYYVMMEE